MYQAALSTAYTSMLQFTLILNDPLKYCLIHATLCIVLAYTILTLLLFIVQASMENPTVIITDTGELQLTSITRHCLLHTIEVIRPHINLSIVLPQSGSHKIDSFCGELQEAILTKHPKKRSTQSLPEDPLVPSIEIHRLCEGAIGSLDFTLIIEKNFLATSKGNINLDAFHRCCWKYYEMERKSEISYPKWFSRECTYRLWLIYNCVLEPDLNTTLSMKTTNEVLKRIVEYCGYTWNPTYAYATATQMSFPEYLAAITTYFEQFKLEMSLTCEVRSHFYKNYQHAQLHHFITVARIMQLVL